LPELVNRFFDIPVLQKGLSKVLLDIPTAIIQIIFGLILLCFYHPAFILFGIVLVTILILILQFTGGRGLETSLQKSKYKYKVAAWLEEMARILISVKLSKSYDMHLKKADDEVTNYLDARNNHFKVLLFQFNVLVVFKTIITAAMLIVGTMLMVNQQLTVGQFIAAEIVILLVLNSVEKLIINLGSIYDTLTAVEKLAELTDKPIETEGTLPLLPEENGLKLEMKDLTFSYNDEKNILNNISLKINANAKVCITGKDSAGKSTLLKVMTGTYTDFKGSFLIDDVPVNNYNLDSLRTQTGVLLNQQDIFQGTLLDNITLGNTSVKMGEIKTLAAITGLSTFIASLKNGYDTLLHPTGRRLPRNVVQKILLVRALVAKPRLLLLEEPWLNFQDKYRRQIIDLLIKHQQTTVVVVSNDEDYKALCTQHIIINESGSIHS
jgi:ABC-type bacteriocin/lantibiotic exporter with double-glycine peptidase domain